MDVASKSYYVNKKVHEWYREGRSLPGYNPGNGHPYLALLLGRPDDSVGSSYFFIEKNHPQLYDQLLGPHGWAVVRALQEQKVQRDESEKSCLAIKGEDKCY